MKTKTFTSQNGLIRFIVFIPQHLHSTMFRLRMQQQLRYFPVILLDPLVDCRCLFTLFLASPSSFSSSFDPFGNNGGS
jgi:hypothetical protein